MIEKLSNNKYNKEQLIKVKADLVKQNTALNCKVEEHTQITEDFDFFINHDTKIDEKFIGEIRKNLEMDFLSI